MTINKIPKDILIVYTFPYQIIGILRYLHSVGHLLRYLVCRYNIMMVHLHKHNDQWDRSNNRSTEESKALHMHIQHNTIHLTVQDNLQDNRLDKF